MTRYVRSTWLQVASGWALSTFTLASLAAVGWYGHHTHWTFGLAGHDHSDAHDAHDVQEGHDARDATHPDAEAHPAGATATSGPRDDAATPAAQTPGSITFEDAADVRRAGIESVPVRTRPVTERIAANGVVRYDERRIAQLSVRAPGSVWRVEKRLGDTVHKGEVLVIIDSAEVGRLKAELLTALVVYESRREALSILEEIRDAVMGRQLREARSAAREARNTLLNAEQALVNLGFELSLAHLTALDDDARAEHMRLLGLPEEVYAGVDSERVSSNLLPLRAPFDGVVIGRDVVVGEIADPSRSIFEIVDLSAMWIVLNVAKEDAARLEIGQRVTFRPDGDEREYVSELSWISTEVDETTRTLQVRAEVKIGQSAASTERLAGLRANAFGRGAIQVDVRHEAQVVPVESLQAIGDEWVVFVPKGATTFEVRRVGRGLESGGTVELLGDLAGITHVVGPGSHVLKSQLLLEQVESGDL
jgi:cobalt-zinc-cadmium efflux system membrane fusion protein